MAEETLKEQLGSAVKNAMRNKDKTRLGTLRMAQSAIKQIEIDERRTTISSTGARGMQDMGRVMNELKSQVLGRVDMAHLSKKVREQLAG